MPRVLALAVTLAAYWLLLSGHYTALLLGLGAASVALVVFLAWRMDIVDHESQPPLHLSMRVPLYWSWLGGQILLAGWDVARRVWSPSLPIRPALRPVTSAQMSELAQVIYANSITLTPGTLSVAVDDDGIKVHALDLALLDELDCGGMFNRVRRLEAR